MEETGTNRVSIGFCLRFFGGKCKYLNQMQATDILTEHMSTAYGYHFADLDSARNSPLNLDAHIQNMVEGFEIVDTAEGNLAKLEDIITQSWPQELMADIENGPTYGPLSPILGMQQAPEPVAVVKRVTKRSVVRRVPRRFTAVRRAIKPVSAVKRAPKRFAVKSQAPKPAAVVQDQTEDVKYIYTSRAGRAVKPKIITDL